MVHCSRCAERAACNSSTRRPGASYLWRSPRTRTLAAARFRPTASSSRVNRRNLIPRSFFGMLPRGARFADFRSTNRATPPFLRTEKAWRRRAATHDRTGVRLWELATGKELRTLQLPVRTLRIAFTPDGTSLVSFVIDDHFVIVFDIERGQIIRRFGGHSKPVSCFALSRDGKMLATSSYDGTIRLWDFASGASRGQLASFPSDRPDSAAWVYGLAFSPDGRSLAGAYQDNSVRVWEMASRAVRSKFDGHRGS